jgi:hypothetical protein
MEIKFPLPYVWALIHKIINTLKRNNDLRVSLNRTEVMACTISKPIITQQCFSSVCTLAIFFACSLIKTNCHFCATPFSKEHPIVFFNKKRG